MLRVIIMLDSIRILHLSRNYALPIQLTVFSLMRLRECHGRTLFLMLFKRAFLKISLKIFLLYVFIAYIQKLINPH